MRIAIVGGGISGLAAAYEFSRMHCDGSDITYTLSEAGARLGGTVETAHVDVPGAGHFTVELGPDGWVSEKPWARELAFELGLAERLTPSNDAERRNWLLRGGQLYPIPQGMRMMVPTDLAALEDSPLLSPAAIAAFRGETARAAELKHCAKQRGDADVTVDEFVRDHFGEEVTTTLAAPLLAGIFGGDITRLSARSVMPAFLEMERQHGSLVTALANREAGRDGAEKPAIFTSLRGGLDSLTGAMAASLQAESVRCETAVTDVRPDGQRWRVTFDSPHMLRTCGVPGAVPAPADPVGIGEVFDAVLLATPAHVTRGLLQPVDTRLAELHDMHASSAVVVALLYAARVSLPRGFGFLADQRGSGAHPALLATTFLHEKYPHSTPAGAMTLRVFFGGAAVAEVEALPDEQISALAAQEMSRILPQLPVPATAIVRRWPRSLPQYELGHAARVAEIRELAARHTGLYLLGNAYTGVGLPDLVRDARATARRAAASGASNGA